MDSVLKASTVFALGVAIVASLGIGPDQATALSLVTTQTRLPAPVGHLSAVYDGQDSIYLLGGDSSLSYNRAVWRYNIESGIIQDIGTFQEISRGTAVLDGDSGDEILYFGGYRAPFEDPHIYRYSMGANRYEPVAVFPDSLFRTRIAWNSADRVAYSFGGWRYGEGGGTLDEINRYSASTDAVDKVEQVLPEKKYEMAVAWNEKEGAAYLFGGTSRTDNGHQVLKFEPPANVTRLGTNLATSMTNPACAGFISDKLAYIVAGHAVQRYNVVTEEAEALSVDHWPSFSFISCTFVPKLKRLYIFGGYGRGEDGGLSRYRDEISYVNL